MWKKLSLDTVGSIGSGLSSIIGNSVNSSNIQDTSLIENYINSQKDSIKGLVDNNSLLANFQNYNMDYINSSDLENPNASMNTLKSAASGAVTGLTVGGPIGAAIGGLLGFGSGILGEVSGANAANREAERLNNMIDDMKNAYIAQIDRVEKKNDQRILANIQKDGGKINIAPSKKGTFTAAAKKHGKSVQAFASQILANKDNYSSAMVKKANFVRNASKWKHADGGYVDGMTGMMKARLALADHFGNPTARRMTYRDTREYQFPNGDRGNVFVSSYDNYVTPHIQDVNGKLTYIENPWEGEENTKRSLQQSIKFDRPEDAIYFGKHYKDIAPMMKYNWKKHGGPITHGLEIDNGITTINNGGTHEENPYEGVQIGVDNQGIPNLVEEGEVVWNDYVFSNRLKPTKEMKKKNKYKGDTFAEVAKYLQKESEERPNDPISQRGLEDSMSKLQEAQELLRSTKASKNHLQISNKFEHGGNILNEKRQDFVDTMYNYIYKKLGQFETFRNNPKLRDLRAKELVAQTANESAYGEAHLGKNNYSGWGAVDKSPRGVQVDNIYAPEIQSPNTSMLQKRYQANEYADNLINSIIGMNTPQSGAYTWINRTPLASPTKMQSPTVGLTVNSIPPQESIDTSGYYKRLRAEGYANNLFTNIVQDILPKSDTAQQEVEVADYNTSNGESDFNGNHLLTDYSNFMTTPVIPPVGLYLDKTNKQGTSTAQTYSQTPDSDEQQGTDASKSGNKLTGIFRYAPVVGSALSVLGDTLGVTNQPDYSNADLIGKAAQNLQTVDFTPVGNYLTYNPFDRNYYSNKLGAQAAATRRSIKDMSGGNRATALAGLLAADYNAQTQLGNLYRQAEEYNQEQKQKVTAFNNAVDQYNAEGALKASIANMQNNQLRLKAAQSMAQMREDIDSAVSASRSANLSNFYNNIGEIGRGNAFMKMIEKNPYLLYGPYGEYKGGEGFKKGGYLTIKSKKRRK